MFAQQTDPLVDLLQWGTTGVIVVLFLVGWIWPKPSVDRILRENDEHHRQNSERLEAMAAAIAALQTSIERRSWHDSPRRKEHDA